MTKKHFGLLYVSDGDTITVTDPCYNRDVWCRMNDIKAKPGKYDCIAWYHTETYEYEGEKQNCTYVARIGIYLNGFIPPQKELKEMGEIGVDAGLCGIFIDKPDYSDEQWGAMIGIIPYFDAIILKGEVDTVGFVSPSGYGVGAYPVCAYRDEKGEIIAIEVVFI